jgi:CheY-like chemotaxis protein
MAKILVIDDDPVICGVIQQILEAEGHHVVLASDGEDGLVKYYKNAPDMVVTDVLMPGKDGLEVLKEIRLRDVSTPVIAFSSGRRAITPDFILTSTTLVGATRTLGKPFTRVQLLEAVRECLKAAR